MKDFQLRNDTKLLFRNAPVADLTSFTVGKKVLFVYGGGSADKMVDLFASLGVEMYFDGEVSVEAVKGINIATLLSADEVTDIVKECLR